MNVKIYTRKNDTNDAVNYYLQIIKQALEEKYKTSVEQVFTVKDVHRRDLVVVISPAAYFYMLLKNPFQQVVFWFQGIFAEEVDYLFTGRKNRLKVRLFTHLERHILKHARLILFVSEAMRRYYHEKFGYQKENYLIIPCFNKQKRLSLPQVVSNMSSKYEIPSFVYAGSISRWQCIEETVYLFSLIKRHFPQATLTLLTSERQEAETILMKYDVSAEIKYVPLTELDKELLKYKYGFILRRDIPLNRVSTPTKLSSYLANGVIPIYSTVIESFKEPLKDKEYAIAADINNLDELYERIVSFEKKRVNVESLDREYEAVFDDFYNETRYKNNLIKALDLIDCK